MPPKCKATAQDKGKWKVSGPSTWTRHVAEPPDDGDIPRFQTEAIKVCYKNKWTPKVCHRERQITRDDFSNHLLEHVIQHCGWHKVAGALHAAYPILVREFFANFNPDIDVPESPYRYKTWVRGQWIGFSPTMIDRYYGLTRTRLDLLLSPHELDMALVARYLYGRDDTWPLATPRFMHDQLTRELRVLHIFVSSNINPTRKRTLLLYHPARLRKIDLGAHIFEFIKELATEVDSQHTIHFSCLISRLCLTQGVSLFSTEEAVPPIPFLNARSVENSEIKIAAGRNRVQAVPAMNANEDYPDEAAPAPPPTPSIGSDLSIQLAQLLAAQTEMSQAIVTIQGVVLHIQRAQEVVLGDLRVVTSQVSHIGSRMETIDENVARISGTVSSFSQQLASFRPSASARLLHRPDHSAPHLPLEST
ncbi:Uncharacterized protein Adt_05754 [Abeliophyllum distichum]|uniref:Putative plant transposon protein domain-containing protein n=1 Tax=Abeliophyllum distichum TaxID=126358 RepID=A0ABD1V687_9LAMI